MSVGLHIVKKARAGKSPVWYVYAWRGGPQIDKVEGKRPKITSDLTDKAAEQRRLVKHDERDVSLAAQIPLFRASPEFTRNAASTQANYQTWLGRIEGEFGDTTLRMWTSRSMRGDVLDWRDKWAHQPRSADEAMKVFNRLLNWIVDRGRLATNVLSGMEQLYDNDRSDLIWEDAHFEAFLAVASPEVGEAVELAACTGLRRGDLVKLPWDAIGHNAIVWKTGKSRGRTMIVVPLLPETKELLDRIKARHESFMAGQRPHRRKPLPDTVLSNSYWRPWTASGFGSRFNDAKQECGLDRNLHDVRGTFATRCILAGLTDDEIATILGWEAKDVAKIRVRYVNDARVVIAIADRLTLAQNRTGNG